MFLDWNKLVWYSSEELSRLDLALVNLSCAVGLPGWERIDLDLCIFKLDYMARAVQPYTERLLPKFRRKRYDYKNSEAYFRSLCLITVVQRDMGVAYNPAKIPDNAPFGDLEDVFIHGALTGPGGTCATMPAVYSAIGRRLSYPIKLVAAHGTTANHLFCRWDEPTGERLNIEATAQGLSCPPDDYYRQGRYEGSKEKEEAGCFLKSQTPKMELGGFLAHRAMVWRREGNLRHCVDAWAWASALVPENKFFLNTLKMRLNDWTAKVRALTPPKFPQLSISAPQRRYPNTLPLDIEQYIYGLMASENMLKDPEFNGKWWERLRRGESLPERVPAVALVDFSPNGSCNLKFEFAARN